MNYLDPAVLRGPCDDPIDRSVRTAVVHEDNLHIRWDFAHEFFHFGAQEMNDRFLVVHGDYEGQASWTGSGLQNVVRVSRLGFCHPLSELRPTLMAGGDGAAPPPCRCKSHHTPPFR